ncbi:MAG: methylmalonyl-CoA mutase family protein [candidate division KSB1 bacterium]|nr:methylmalonyl-CoA mutase family protein [candidate division KSB1 bacterium]MDZ7274483.1 methylmalonyl-CoA mutase family protein [candidate division KSB1 bacterium]MDZ7284855.1 methylmalonyl-CoA mutase family protein [candidate division KSB1 bacterium]MDZ7297725.1 methylmalonyl-CoA mutase family protein [candidate division KSB1 bacterium]MDZ7309606.1 methylmalonyl-CoA mutase family protein [candidate division KSB1 bacterium]
MKTDADIELKNLYTAADVPAAPEPAGEYPFTRGIFAEMYRARLWTMRQYSGYATAEDTNARFHYLLSQGQTGLSTAFDLPTQMGYDSDHKLADGEVGRVGVAISSLEDMERLFAGIRLDQVTTSMTINATAAILLALYIAVAKKQNADLKAISGTVQNDILKEYIARATYIFPPAPSLRLVTDMFEFCSQHLPKWNPISISGYHIREAGSDAVQEVAFTFANAIEYVRHAVRRGLDVNVFGPRLSFFFNSHNHFFEEIAKFRAARRLWARIMKERFGATNPRAMMLRFHTQTAGSTLTAQQPDNNIVRVTLQALAAVLGGTQSLHTNSRDEALALPTEESVMIALRTQQIIAYESGVPAVTDPLGGSYLVESLTNEIARRAENYIEKIEALGGAVAAIEAGYFQEEISRRAWEYQQAVERGEKIIVGVNKFQVKEEKKIDLLRVDPRIQAQQIQRLAALRRRRDHARVSELRQHLEAAARGRDNLMPYIIACVEGDVTLGEIADSLREVFGRYQAK